MARGAEPRGTHSAGGELAFSCRIPFVLSCMAAGREDMVTSAEEGGGVWKQWLCFWDSHLASLRKLMFPSSVMETVGDGLRLFSIGIVVARQLFYTL